VPDAAALSFPSDFWWCVDAATMVDMQWCPFRQH